MASFSCERSDYSNAPYRWTMQQSFQTVAQPQDQLSSYHAIQCARV